MNKVICGAFALSLLGSSALAQTTPPAGPDLTQSKQQSAPAQPETSGRTSAPDHTTPPTGEAQPQNPQADQAKPAAVGPAQANTAGTIQTETPPGSTPQTMPSTISKENAARDKLPTTALQFPLTDDQKRIIVSGLGSAPDAKDATLSAKLKTAHVADFVPGETALQDFPAAVTQQIPAAGRYKFVQTDAAVLIIDPPLSTVVGEIKR